jgi:hypothetical protein
VHAHAEGVHRCDLAAATGGAAALHLTSRFVIHGMCACPQACRRVAYDIPCARKNSQSSSRCNAHIVRRVGIKCAAASLLFVCLQRLELQQLHNSEALLALCCCVCSAWSPKKRAVWGHVRLGRCPGQQNNLGWRFSLFLRT